MFEFSFNFWSFVGGMFAGAVGLFIGCFIVAFIEDRRWYNDDYPSFEG